MEEGSPGSVWIPELPPDASSKLRKASLGAKQIAAYALFSTIRSCQRRPAGLPEGMSPSGAIVVVGTRCALPELREEVRGGDHPGRKQRHKSSGVCQ